MKEKLLSFSSLDVLPRWRMSSALCILMLIICGAAYSQPTIVSPIANGSKNFISVGGTVYFSEADNLYKATATSAASLVKATGETIVKLYDIPLGANFFFITENGTTQRLWRSDGTTANTASVMTATQITPLLTYNSELYLQVNSTTSGTELWKMNGSYTTSIVKDINPGAARGYFGSLTVFNNLLYFIADTGSGQNIWQTNGTAAGTVLSVDLDDEIVYNASWWHSLTVVNDRMYFTRDYEYGDYDSRYADLWSTDGTPDGTSLVWQSDNASTYNYLSHFLPHKGKLYFFHTIGDVTYHYISVSDGTTAGTRHLDLTSIDGAPRKLINAEDYLLFYAESQGFTTPIERYDGTSVTQVHQFSYYHMMGDEYIDLTYTDDNFAFFIDDVNAGSGTTASQLWQADVAAGTAKTVEEIHGITLINSRNITAAGGSSIFFTRVVDGQMSLWYYNPKAPTCGGTGTIQQEKWNNVAGYSIASIPVNNGPSSIINLTEFSTPRNSGDNYGARVRGYLCIPQDGNYTFYISSDDNSELWLSTDDNPANKRLIASSKWTNYNQWDKYTTQQSAPIALQTGRKYYIEALHKEAAGADHLSVGWRLPDGTLERPIPGARLIPLNRGVLPTISITQPATDHQTFVSPATIEVVATADDSDGAVDFVEFYASGRLLDTDSTAPYTTQWYNDGLGDYEIEARATDNEGNIASARRLVRMIRPPSCEGTGTILRELWSNVPGTDVRTFDFSSAPDTRIDYHSFETPQYFANNYASRIRAKVCVPQSGNYTFWISSDDYSQLYLSTDETEANKRLIAWVYGATTFRKYDKYPSQKSAQIYLEAGRQYFIEARHKEGTGNDFISVGWQLPDGTLERPIGGNRLIGVPSTYDGPPSITITSPMANQNFTSPASISFTSIVKDPDGVDHVTYDIVYGNDTTRFASFEGEPGPVGQSGVGAGSYTLIVTATDNKGMTSTASLNYTVDITECGSAGRLRREFWRGIPGTSISSIPVNTAPDGWLELSGLFTPNYYGNDYGSRIRGYFCAPETGAYTFWISGDDNVELWLSTSDDPAGKQKVAYASTATAVNQWDKYSSQMSATINLTKAHKYYFEVLQKEANGADHVEVGWRLPSGTLERPIPGNRVIPYWDPATSASDFAMEGLFDLEEQDEISVYPNPVASGKKLSITLPANGPSGDLRVELLSMTGVSVQSENLTSEGTELAIELKPTISPGMYLIKVADSRKRWTKKIQVE